MHAAGLPRHATLAPIAGVAAPARVHLVLAAALVALMAAGCFLVRPGEPAGLVWDEGYYATSTQRYLDGRAQFGTHPPLGLMLLAAGEAALQPNRLLDTSHVGDAKHISGEALPVGYSPAAMRLASGVAATLCALAAFGLVMTLLRSLAVALVVANLFVFDNALVAHLRAAHLDAFQLLFALLALWAFVAAMPRRRAGWREIALGAFGALALLVKLNAAWLLVPAMALVLRRARQRQREGAGVVPVLVAAGATALPMLASGMLATLLVLAIHVSVGHRMPDEGTPAGRQDTAFIDGEYRRYLQGERGPGMAVLLDAARGHARFMAADISGMGLGDANGSTPWQWLRQQRTINYRWDSDGTRTAYVQLVPNPVGWALASLSPLAVAWLLVLQWWRPLPGRTDSTRTWIAAALLAAWIACFALHLWIASQRVMYLYHAFNGLLLAFMLAPLAWTMARERWPGLRGHGDAVTSGVVVLHLAAFLWLSPLSLHRPLDHAGCERRNLPWPVLECRS